MVGHLDALRVVLPRGEKYFVNDLRVNQSEHVKTTIHLYGVLCTLDTTTHFHQGEVIALTPSKFLANWKRVVFAN